MKKETHLLYLDGQSTTNFVLFDLTEHAEYKQI